MINIDTLDLNLLRVFDALIRYRKVSTAAQRLRVTQSAASNALNRLRVVCGDQLFVRTRNGMEPTALALQLRDPIQQGLATIWVGLGKSAAFDPQTSSRVFTLVMNDIGEISFLPPLLGRLATSAPSVDIRVLELGREEYADYLDSGKADLAIGNVRLPAAFKSQLIHTGSYVALLRKGHPLLKRNRGAPPTISYEDYLTARHISVSPRGAMSNPVDNALGSDAIRRRIALTVPHATVLTAIIPGTDLVATVPEKCVDTLCTDGRLCWAPLPFEIEAHNPVHQWWHKRQDQDPGHRWLRQVIARLLPRYQGRTGARH